MSGYIGQPIARIEDRRLIAGRGCYTDDIKLDRACWASFLRSPHAHAVIEHMDLDAARHATGVLAVLILDDYLGDGHRPISHIPNPVDAIDVSKRAFVASPESAVADVPHPPLARDKVRHVGEAIVMVLAETPDAARDAVDLVEIRYAELPAVIDQRDAMREGAPQLWEAAPRNICFDKSFGNLTATDAAFAAADHVVECEFRNSRIVTCQMEPRAAIGFYDEEHGIYELLSGSQGAHRIRMELSLALGVPAERIRVRCPDTGGGFGTRTFLYVEQLLVTWAARRLGRPVRWTSERSEAFLSDYQGRDLFTRAAMALSRDGTILGMRTEVLGNVGAHTVSFVPVANNYRVTTTTYRIPAAHVRCVGVLTNTVPTAPFRGAGRPEAHFTVERLLDIAARELQLDRLEIRRKNLLRREDLPFRNALGLTYDSGDFTGNFNRAVAMCDWNGFKTRQEESAAKGKLRGIGISPYVESPVGAIRERVEIKVHPDTRVEVLAGTQSTGQGHETTFAQVVADILGTEISEVTLITGDTNVIAVGGGSHSDRSMRLGGSLLVKACTHIIDQAKDVFAAELNTSITDIAFDGGTFRHGKSNQAKTLLEIAGIARDQGTLLHATADFNGRMPAYPTGAAVCELEIDPETGEVAILRYTSVDDVGQPINPRIVDGQVHGGIAQGVGQALMENFQIDPATGQVPSGSFMDYGVPRADDLPRFDVALTEDPTDGNPLRIKGGGESGITPSLACIFNALFDALTPYGVTALEMPATPERIWRAIREASAGKTSYISKQQPNKIA